jgi:hypothetical protein
MILDGLLTQVQPFSDLPIFHAFGHFRDDLLLSSA